MSFGEWCHLRDLVIPAKAGIHSANLWKCAIVPLDSRFRGNDRRLEWIPIPNGTNPQEIRLRLLILLPLPTNSAQETTFPYQVVCQRR